MFKNIRVPKLLFLLFITTIVVVEVSLSKYFSTQSTNTSTQVAKWDNNIVIVGDDFAILDNNQINSEMINFNVVSNSEVTSKFDIGLDDMPKDITIRLSNNSKEASVLVANGNITVSIGLDEETFTIPNTASTVTSGNITMTSMTITNGINLQFTKSNEEMNIEVTKVNNADEYNILFNNFGIISKGENQAVSHILAFETSALDLPGSQELELYAIIEQID